jgi:acyl carrier protein phosphodiesterase
MLHRRIDSFADTHPAFRRSRARVSDTRKRFGGVLVDMFYDHFLAVHWHRFSPEPLVAFTAETYRLIGAHDAPLPPPSGRSLPAWPPTTGWASYRDSASVALALDRMAHHRACASPTPWPAPVKSCWRNTRGWRRIFWISSRMRWRLRNEVRRAR